ncbi:MAG: heavy metal translocating P-type ATPase [Eubacteriales bacterium]|nr:heavy metal translocating P-type ATPase [Eubacteriales bacterium]MDY3332214.1 heavy metal translocating P-type ATPase [Gallibacter sp.]
MRCTILHESKGRLRIHMEQNKMSMHQADILEYYLKSIDCISDVKVYERTADAIILYTSKRENVIDALSRFTYQKYELLVPEYTGRLLNRQYEDKIMVSIFCRFMGKMFLPSPVRVALIAFRAARCIYKGVASLSKGKIEVALLDSVAISVSMLRRDFGTASSVMFLLNIGEMLEEWTHKKSVGDLAATMSLGVDKVWLVNDDTEILIPITEIEVGDCIVVRTGNMIALDGKVVSGEATVNQASITGESLPVRKEVGSYAYAGTVVEEGECVICVDKASGSGRYDKIVKMIEESEKLKSMTENRAAHLADKLVPFSLGGTILIYLLTRNVTKALSVLMVDFSCALKLSMPLAVLSAMRESSYHGITVKGGKFLEAVSEADTIVFDKTGTLTHATPTVAKIVAFNGQDENEALRLAACLEEHYPHSIANAVVKEASDRGLHHEESHSKVEYIVAHGISSIVDGKKAIIGSYHFVFEDEACIVPKDEQDKFEKLPGEYSHLYLAVSGVLSAVICIDDPLRDEAAEVISTLKRLGINNTVMMTGDNEKTASVVAKAVGVDKYYAEVLPEDKAEFIRKEHAAGRKVIMIGDGVNDSPALSEADAGIAISDGAAIAREVADITISADDLYSLVTLKSLSDALMDRIDGNYKFIIGFNVFLIGLGIAGILPPTASAFLHNTSTIGVGVKSMTNLLK